MADLTSMPNKPYGINVTHHAWGILGLIKIPSSHLGLDWKPSST